MIITEYMENGSLDAFLRVCFVFYLFQAYSFDHMVFYIKEHLYYESTMNLWTDLGYKCILIPIENQALVLSCTVLT